jgi:holo-[acyl-carrier protein] synthase
MILGIGIDLVEVSRVDALVARHGDRALRRIFTAAEVERCSLARSPSESLAARFAAKEAFFKAVGTGWGSGLAWTEVEVVSTPSGAPEVRLSGAAERLARERGVSRIHLSLTHTDALASAYLLLEGPEASG